MRVVVFEAWRENHIGIFVDMLFDPLTELFVESGQAHQQLLVHPIVPFSPGLVTNSVNILLAFRNKGSVEKKLVYKLGVGCFRQSLLRPLHLACHNQPMLG